MKHICILFHICICFLFHICIYNDKLQSMKRHGGSGQAGSTLEMNSGHKNKNIDFYSKSLRAFFRALWAVDDPHIYIYIYILIYSMQKEDIYISYICHTSSYLRYKNLLRLNLTFLQNGILSLKKIKPNIRSCPVKKLSISATLYLLVYCVYIM